METATRPQSTPEQRQASLVLVVEVKLGNKQVTMSLLILPGVVDPLVLGWNFLKEVGTEIRCA